MLNERLKAAHAVRDAYMGLKLSTAALAAQAVTCAQTMTAQRQPAGLKIGDGTEALANVVEAAALIARAEKLIADAHPELGRLIGKAGLNRHFGFGYGSEDTEPFTGAGMKPVIVETARAA